MISLDSRTIGSGSLARTVGLFAAMIIATAAPAPGFAAPPRVGDLAPDFELDSLDGERVKLSEVSRKGPVVLIVLRGYPGYQCPVCNAQVGGLLSKAREFQSAGSRVVLVYPGPSNGLKQRAGEFIRGKTLPENFQILLDPGYAFTKSYGLRWDAPGETAYPSAFVIDGQRMVRFSKVSQSHGGRATAAELLDAVWK